MKDNKRANYKQTPLELEKQKILFSSMCVYIRGRISGYTDWVVCKQNCQLCLISLICECSLFVYDEKVCDKFEENFI